MATKKAAKPAQGDQKKQDASIAFMPATECPGLGEVSGKKLEPIGVTTVAALAATPPQLIKDTCECDLKSAIKWSNWARRALEECGFLKASVSSALDLLKAEKGIERLTTGTAALDKFFRGGIATGEFIAVAGDPGHGKSQLCYQMAAVTAAAGKKVVYLETEGAFRIKRLVELIEARGHSPEDVLPNVDVVNIINTAMFRLHLEGLMARMKDDPFDLLIIDSLNSPQRFEYVGRGKYDARSQHLSPAISHIRQLNRVFGVRALVSLQVWHDPNIQHGDNMKIWGGNVMMHAFTKLAKVSKTSQGRNKHLFKMLDSPEDANIELVLWSSLDGSGFVDTEGGGK